MLAFGGFAKVEVRVGGGDGSVERRKVVRAELIDFVTLCQSVALRSACKSTTGEEILTESLAGS